MASRCSLRINGVTHRMIQQKDGSIIYDPPLPKSEIARGRNNIGEMIRAKSFPGLKTESNFFSNRGTLEQQFKDDPEFLQEIIAGAQADGYNPNPNDVYVSQIARKTGDRKAFVSQADGVSKIRKVCEEQKLHCEELGTERYEVAPKAPVKLADDLVQQKVAEYKSHPEFSRMKDQELREFVVEQHGARS